MSDRPTDRIRVADRWKPFAHYIAVLPAALERCRPPLEVAPGGRVLDFGCAEQPYRSFFPAGVEVLGADLPGNPGADLEIDEAGRVPAADGAFDAVLSTQVLEHVPDPAGHLAECARVLRPGGRLLLSTHGVFYLHPDPVDYWRWTSAGLRHEVERAGLRVVEFEGVFGMGATGLQLVLDAVLPQVPRVARPVLCRMGNSAIAFADRRQSAAAKQLNAAVYVVVAEKPLAVDER